MKSSTVLLLLCIAISSNIANAKGYGHSSEWALQRLFAKVFYIPEEVEDNPNILCAGCTIGGYYKASLLLFASFLF